MQVYNDPGQGPKGPPIFRQGFPVVILALTGAIVAVTLMQFNVSPQLEQWMYVTGGIIGGPSYVNLSRPWGDFAPYVLHVFLHVNSIHLMMNMAMLIALGPIVSNGLGNTVRGAALFLGFFFLCAIGGAAAEFLQFYINATDGAAIGASSAISGLLPAVGFVRNGWRGAWSISVPWLLFNLALALVGGNVVIMQVAWAAHLGGLAAGFSYPVFVTLSRPAR